MSAKELISRIQNKIDTQAEWNKTDFIPEKGEAIVYAVDEIYLNTRLKVGDGVHKLSELPYASTAIPSPDLIIVSVPSQTNTLTYNGSTQNPVWRNYDSSAMIISGTQSAINAGSYTAHFTLNSGYAWPDGSTDVKSVTWTIRKANATLLASPTSLTYTVSDIGVVNKEVRIYSNVKFKTASNVVATYDTVELIVSSPTQTDTPSTDSNYANYKYYYSFYVTHEGTTTDNVSITFSITDTNYTANKVECYAKYEASKSLNDYTWEEIADIAKSGTADNYFDIGDTKTIRCTYTSLNMDVDVYIMHMYHPTCPNGIQFGAFMFQGKPIGIGDKPMSEDNTNDGGWKDSYMRYNVLGSTTSRGVSEAPDTTPTSPLLGSLMYCLPSDLRAVMLPMHIYSNNSGPYANSSDITETTDYLPLLAEFEILGRSPESGTYEAELQSQYQYYAEGNSKLKYTAANTVTPSPWWTRSIPETSYNNYVGIDETGASIGYEADDSTNILTSPVFSVGKLIVGYELYLTNWSGSIEELVNAIDSGEVSPENDCDMVWEPDVGASGAPVWPAFWNGYSDVSIEQGVIEPAGTSLGIYDISSIKYMRYTDTSYKWYYAADYDQYTMYLFEMDAVPVYED